MVKSSDIWTRPEQWYEWPSRFRRIYFSEDRREYFGSHGFIGSVWLCARLAFDDLMVATGLRPTQLERIQIGMKNISRAFDNLSSQLNRSGIEAEKLWKALKPMHDSRD